MSKETNKQRAAQVVQRLIGAGWSARIDGNVLVVDTLRLSLSKCIEDPEFAFRALASRSIERGQPKTSADMWHNSTYHSFEKFSRHVADRSG